VKLPETAALTKHNYTMPCSDIATCKIWFCTKFMAGPVARVEKLVDPQDYDEPSVKK